MRKILQKLVEWFGKIAGIFVGTYIFLIIFLHAAKHKPLYAFPLIIVGLIGSLLVIRCFWEDSKKEAPKDPYPQDPEKCYIVWCWGDIQSIRPDWSEQKCKIALSINYKHLRDRSIELGWDVLQSLLTDSVAHGDLEDIK